MPKIIYSQPCSVIRVAPRSGIFASSSYIHDQQGFIAKVLGKWFCERANTLAGETPQHLQAAESLFDFYIKYRIRADAGCGGLGSVLGELIETGSISCALDALNVADAHGIYIYDKHEFGFFGNAFRKKNFSKIPLPEYPANCSQLADLMAVTQDTYLSINPSNIAVWVDQGQEFKYAQIVFVEDHHDISRLGLLTEIHRREVQQSVAA
jgi:hypothetical protein